MSLSNIVLSVTDWIANRGLLTLKCAIHDHLSIKTTIDRMLACLFSDEIKERFMLVLR